MATIEARVKNVQQNVDTGWYRIELDHEEIKKLETKHAERAREAADLKKSGALAMIEYSENPRTDPATGRTYPNRYWTRGVEIDSPNGAGDDGIERVQATRSKTDPSDAWRMALTSGTERAVQTLPMMKEGQRSFDDQKKIALAWARFIFFTPPPDTNTAVALDAINQMSQSIGQPVPGNYEAPPPHTDEDIPF